MSFSPKSTDKDSFMLRVKERSEERVGLIHSLSKKIWSGNDLTPFELQGKCMDAWETLGDDIGSKIVPLIPVKEERPITNLIFGSGSFSTGSFQAAQYGVVKGYASKPPVILQAIVANKSVEHGCNGRGVSEQFNVPLVELDFIDWYHEMIDESEENPIRASRYWYLKDDPKRPPASEIEERFKIRQERFHGDLGGMIKEFSSFPTDIVSARGYNFQFCSNIFKHQETKPHVNDTHPADLTYVDPSTGEKLYPGWQSGAVQLMINNNHDTFRGSLIEVGYMDTINQIDELDEGALLAIGEGITPHPNGSLDAKEIQSAMKQIDDYIFCTLEPTGLFLTWGITEKCLDVPFQDVRGNEVLVNQHVIVVGDKIKSGTNAWGKDLEQDLRELEEFLLH
ncbi:MAG: hypothetical protein ACFFCS_17295 [Candidatus Hodarchaeota archaeon]